MTDVTVTNQSAGVPPITILVNSGTNGVGNTGWTFTNNCTAGTYTWIGGTAWRRDRLAGGRRIGTRRGVPAVGDRLIFDGNNNDFTPTFTVTNVPTVEHCFSDSN